MNWPWISRRAYDLLLDERDRLRERNDQLTDHVTRMDRLEHGAGELKPQLRVQEPMPNEVVTLIRMFDSETTRSDVTRRAQSLYKEVGSWDPVIAELAEATRTEIVEE